MVGLPEHAVREFANKLAASVASPDHVKFQAVIKSSASAASPEIKMRLARNRRIKIQAKYYEKKAAEARGEA